MGMFVSYYAINMSYYVGIKEKNYGKVKSDSAEVTFLRVRTPPLVVQGIV